MARCWEAYASRLEATLILPAKAELDNIFRESDKLYNLYLTTVNAIAAKSTQKGMVFQDATRERVDEEVKVLQQSKRFQETEELPKLEAMVLLAEEYLFLLVERVRAFRAIFLRHSQVVLADPQALASDDAWRASCDATWADEVATAEAGWRKLQDPELVPPRLDKRASSKQASGGDVGGAPPPGAPPGYGAPPPGGPPVVMGAAVVGPPPPGPPPPGPPPLPAGWKKASSPDGRRAWGRPHRCTRCTHASQRGCVATPHASSRAPPA